MFLLLLALTLHTFHIKYTVFASDFNRILHLLLKIRHNNLLWLAYFLKYKLSYFWLYCETLIERNVKIQTAKF